MPEKPAVLLITADELLCEALSCYGNQAVATPNIDRIAATGLRFDSAYTVSPWCLPARCSMLTGLLPHNSGAYSNFRKCALDEGVPNLYKELKTYGYVTAHIGKCHFAPVPYGRTQPDKTLPYGEFRNYYLRLGMDRLALQDDKQVSVWFRDDYADELDRAGLLEDYRNAVWEGKNNGRVFPFPGPAEWHPDTWVGRKAVQCIEQHDPDKPFFAWISFSGPHYPMDPPAEYLDCVDMSRDTLRRQTEGEFDNPDRLHHTSYHGRGGIDGCAAAPAGACKNYDDAYWRRMRHHYYANVAQIDEWVGRILDAAEKRFEDNTLVIFTADHGEMLGNHGLWGKHDSAYREVLRIPLAVNDPGSTATPASSAASSQQKTEPAGTGPGIDALVSTVDVTATCLAAAGGPSEFGDGKDLRQLVPAGGRTHVLSEGEGFVAITDGIHTLVRVQQPGRRPGQPGRFHDELYDRSVDPGQVRNFIDDPDHAPAVATLRAKALNTMMETLLP